MNQKKWVIGNWKMNPASVDEVFELCQSLANNLAKDKCWQSSVLVGIAPSFVHLGLADYALSQAFLDDELPIFLCSQDVAKFDKAVGAFTGDVSAHQVMDLAEWTLIGHSERRQYHGDDEAVLSAKINNALNANLSVVYCVGESKEAYEQGKTQAVLESQLAILAQFAKQIASKDEVFPRLVIAYEPVWAIGTGLTPTVEEVESVHSFIGQLLSTFKMSVPIIYGGSVNDGNAPEFAKSPLIDGVLVGGASLQAERFVAIVNAFAK